MLRSNAWTALRLAEGPGGTARSFFLQPIQIIAINFRLQILGSYRGRKHPRDEIQSSKSGCSTQSSRLWTEVEMWKTSGLIADASNLIL